MDGGGRNTSEDEACAEKLLIMLKITQHYFPSSLPFTSKVLFPVRISKTLPFPTAQPPKLGWQLIVFVHFEA